MTNENIRKGLDRLSLLLREGKVECSSIHTKAGHLDHTLCYVIGLDATPEMMSADGSRGNYFYMDEKGQLHRQNFVQGPDGHDWGEDLIISTKYFLDYIKNLPREKMANSEEVISRLNQFQGGSK